MKTATAVAEEIARVLSDIETLECSVEGDFDSTQEATSETLIARLGELKSELEKSETRDAAKRDADETVARVRATAPRVIVRSEAAPEISPQAAGEWLVARIAADEEIRSGSGQTAQRAFRTLSDIYMSDVSGIIPTPVLSNVIDRQSGNRPVFNAFQGQGNPPGKTFEQPYVTAHTSVDEQVAEGDELASSKYTVGTYTLTTKTYGGAVVLSAQAIDFSSPSAMQKVVADLEKQYNRKTELVVSNALNTASADPNEVVLDTTSITTLAQSIERGYQLLESNLDEVNPADLVLFVSADQYAAITTKYTAEGQNFVDGIPGFPTLVRGRRLPAYAAFLADRSGLRVWEQRKGQNELMRVSTLEWEVGIYGYLAVDIASGSVIDLSYAGS